MPHSALMKYLSDAGRVRQHRRASWDAVTGKEFSPPLKHKAMVFHASFSAGRATDFVLTIMLTNTAESGTLESRDDLTGRHTKD